MSILLFLIKFYIVVLLMRYFSTPQELNFNPLGKIIAMITDPLFKLTNLRKEQSDKYIFVIIAFLIFFSIFMQMVGNGFNIANFLIIYLEFTRFFMQLLIVATLLGAIIDVGYASYYFVYFYRLSKPFVKFTSFFVRIKSKWIILPTVIIIFGLYLLLVTPVHYLIFNWDGKLDINAINTIFSNTSLTQVLLIDIKGGLFGLVALLRFYSYIIIIRALISWVAPDPRTTVFQILFALTEPILSAFRKIIPPIGMLDLSAMVAVFVTYFISAGLYRLVAMIGS